MAERAKLVVLVAYQLAGLKRLASCALGLVGILSAALPTTVAATNFPHVKALDIVAGYYHTCAIIEGGYVRCWGDNEYGQLGDGTASTSNALVARDVVGVSNAIALAAGLAHTCAIESGGTVKCWGSNALLQLGVAGGDSLVPVTVSDAAGATAIAAGDNTTCAIDGGGTVKCWGAGGSGQLGIGSSPVSSLPVLVPGISGATAVTVGGIHACVLVSGGQGRCWGTNSFAQLGNNTNLNSNVPVPVTGLGGMTSIAAASTHTCAGSTNSLTYCWGDNTFGQIGKGSQSFTPPYIPYQVSGTVIAQAVALGYRFSCALLTTGDVKCWGNNNVGQLGNANETTATVPVAVLNLSGITKIAAGGHHVCVVDGAGEVRCWGSNANGELGNDAEFVNLAPVDVTIAGTAVKVAAGWKHSCVTTAAGSMLCSGKNTTGQVGWGAYGSRATHVNVASIGGGVSSIAAGFASTCAIAGQVYCWGDAYVSGDTGQRPSAFPIVQTFGATAVSLRYQHACAVMPDGSVRCWGFNYQMQLGDGTVTPRALSVPVATLSGATAVSTTNGSSCAIVTGGAIKCWGDNDGGALGNGIPGDSAVPVDVVGISGATAIAGGEAHHCAIVVGGNVKCWGINTNGQLGDNTITSRTTPVDVVGLSGATALAAGRFHTCALVAGGAIKCWGQNMYGELGNQTAGNIGKTPVDVIGVVGATALSAGESYTCAVVSGALKCWGYDYDGQFGDGTAAYHNANVGALDGAAATSLHVSGCPSPQVAGTQCTLNVAARNASGGAAVRYFGSTAFTSSDPAAILPGAYTWVPIDGGSHAFAAYLTTIGTHSISVTDQANAGISGAQAGIVVVAGPPNTITATGGTPQTTTTGSPFAQTLQATVRDGFNNPVAGASVQFILPSFGPSATFPGSALLAVATTDAAGVASSPQGTANGVQGEYAVFASVNGVFGSAAFILTNGAAPPASVTATGGTPQSSAVNSAFAAPLQATVRDAGGNALPGVDVVFTLPASGASGLFAGGTTSATVATDSNGIANAPTLTANATEGAFVATATVAGVAVPAQFALTNTSAPIQVAEVLSLATGGRHSCVIESASGAVRCWGDNGYGQLGDGTNIGRADPRPVVGLTGRALMVGTGLWTSCALMDTGGVKCWGYNNRGRVGDGTTIDRTTPVDVVGLSSGVIAVGVGGAHACALLQTGGMRCWGWNGNGGQLGNGTLVDSAVPVDVVGLASGVVAIGTGDSHTCALLADATVKCWGLGGNGQLGAGSFNSSPVPVDVAGLGDVASLASGGLHTCALKADGQVQCWGDNSSGELGDGTTTRRATAGPVTGLANIIGVSSSEFHTCALTNSSGMACWGNNSYGQIGTGTTAAQLTPFTAPQFNNLAAVRAGWMHTCVLGNQGGVQCVGDNTYGQLGDNGPSGSATPTVARNLDSSTITLEVASGAGQSANIDAPFAQPLTAIVRDKLGQPMAGVPVQFSIVRSGAAATFATGARVALAISDASGAAISPSFAANSAAGSYAAAAVIVGRSARVDFALTNGAPTAGSITAVGGSMQSASIGSPFPQALQALVKDAGGNPLANVAVTFTLPASGASGTFAGGSMSVVANSDSSGIATSPSILANLTLGTWNAAANVTGVASPATFSLTNVAGAPASIVPFGGTPQTTMAGTVFGAVLQARVADSNGNAVAGVTVTFTLPASGATGNFPGPTKTSTGITDLSGVASSPAITASSTSGTFAASAAVAGVPGVASFALTSVTRTGATVTATLGSPQSAVAGTTFALPLTATVRDGAGNPIAGLTLTFTIPGTTVSGTFAGGGKTATMVTDAAGSATSPAITATTKVGTFIPYASVAGLARANFSLAITPDVPALVTARVGAQTAAVYLPFAKAPAVRVTDQFANVVPNVPVTFTLPASGATATFDGALASTVATTNATGIATAPVITANNIVGTYYAEASVSGVATPATFKLTNNAGAGATLETSGGTPQTATVATDYGQPLQATVRDATARPVAGVAVTFALSSSTISATFPGGTRSIVVLTDASGNAVSPSLTATTRSGAFTPSARASGISGVKYFNLTNTAAAPATAVATVGAQVATIGLVFAKPLGVTIKDGYGNVVPGVPVQISLAAGSPSAKFADDTSVFNGVTDATGKAVSPSVIAQMHVGAHVATTVVTGLASAPTFSLRNAISAGATIVATGGTPQSTPINSPFPDRLQAIVRDANSQPIGGVVVTFAVPSSRASFAGGGTSAPATTDATGTATSPQVIASGTRATWTATGKATGVSGTTASYTLTNQ